MSGQAQIDYDALADQARKQSAPSVAAPKKAVHPAAVDYDALAAQARHTRASAPPAPDFTTNTIDPTTGRGYGLYRMAPPGNSQKAGESVEINVPYNRVRDAQAAGYSLHPDDAPKYQKDSTNEGKGPSTYERVASLLTRMTDPMPDTPLTGSAWNQANAAVGNVEKLPFNVVNRTLRGVAGLPQGMAQTAAGLWHGDPAAIESLDPATMGENAYRGLNEDTASLGPMAALGNLGGDAATMYVAGKAGPRIAEASTDPMLRVVKGVRDFPESFARVVTNTGKAPIEQLVKDAQAANKTIDAVNLDRTEAQRAKQADADTDYRGGLLKLRRQYEQQIRDANQKFAGNKAKAEQVNAEALRAYNQKVGQIIQQRRAVAAAEQARSAAAAQTQVVGSQLIYRVSQLDKALRAQANALYSKVSEIMSGASLPSDTIADGVKAAQQEWIRGSPAKVAEFNAMLSTGTPGPELVLADQTAQNMGYKDFRSAITNPRMRDTLSRALPPDVWQAAIGQGTRPISWNDLQGFYEETGAKIAEGPQPGKGDIYKALQQVHQFVGDQMQELARQRGAGPQLRDARSFYRDYMNAFHEPAGPSGSGSPVAQVLLAKDPAVAIAKFSGSAGDRGVALLRRYDPNLADLAQQARGIKHGSPAVGAGRAAPKSIADLPTPKQTPVPAEANLPPPPVLPEPKTVPLELRLHQTISSPDIAAARRAAAEARTNKVWNRGQWAATWPIFQAARALWGGHIPSIPMMGLESAGMLATVKATTGLMRYPPMIRFLEQARPADIPLIPLELRGDLPGLVSQAQQQGIKVSPALTAAAAAYAGMVGQQDQQHIPVAQAIQAIQSTQSQGAPQ